MFTGIVRDVGEVVAREPMEGGGARLRIASRLFPGGWRLGDSIAVEGCCLTVTGIDAHIFSAELSPETLAVTTLGALRPGARVNLEPALKAGEPLGGHFVTGHVDGVGTVVAVEARDGFRFVEIEAPETLARYLVPKGSVAVAGVSLTVNAVAGARFSLCLIPHTLAATNLGRLVPGDRVNLETDLLGRYVERLMQPSGAAEAGKEQGCWRAAAS